MPPESKFRFLFGFTQRALLKRRRRDSAPTAGSTQEPSSFTPSNKLSQSQDPSAVAAEHRGKDREHIHPDTPASDVNLLSDSGEVQNSEEVTTMNVNNLPDENSLERLTPTEAMALASNAKLVQSARKYTAMHKLRRCKSDLRVARDRVHECEEVLANLEKEIKLAEENIEVLDSGMVGIQRLVVQAEQLKASNDTGSARSSFYASDHNHCTEC